MRIGIAGSRSITDAIFVYKYLDIVIKKHVPETDSVTIISGGARGVDTIAMQYARDNGMDFVLFKPYHLIDRAEPYRPRFFFTRNKQIADNSDLVVAFWTNESHGTKHMIDYCRKNHKTLVVVEPEDGDLS